MTAVIGILNKSAIAIAADSAATVTGGNGRKIYNSANKIFRLSKFEPVGIAIYNSSSFMSTPWEIIIKEYRRGLGKKKFNNLKDYKSDFFQFIKRKSYFSSKIDLLKYLYSYARQIFEQNLLKEIILPNEFDSFTVKKQEKYLNTELENRIIKLNNEIKTLPKCDSLLKLSQGEFNTYYSDSLNRFFDEIETALDFSLDDNLVKIPFKSLLFTYFTSSTFNSFTGLVFLGYGDLEYYPVCISCNVADVICDFLRISETKETTISDQNQAVILPFAQRDVIDTIITGINPTIKSLYEKLFERFLLEYNKTILSLEPKLETKLSSIKIDQIKLDFNLEVEKYLRSKIIEPTIDSITLLSKEDLSEMAESLIFLTYLKRRISFEEESVGGPVDVAIISKGDGFIWIKRKHYFNKDLNPHFFKNYNL